MTRGIVSENMFVNCNIKFPYLQLQLEKEKE
jgi:hypothetical protein